MPKKAGGKKKKDPEAGLSEEEKLVLREQKAQAEAEAKKNKADMALRFLKEKLEQEEINSKMNIKKLNVQWQIILRNEKAVELKQDISILNQTFERVVDRKDAILKSLCLDLEEAEIQSLTAARHHIENVDNLIAFQHRLLAELREKFNGELEGLKSEFMVERELILKQHEKEIIDLKNIIFAMQMIHDDINAEAANEFSSKKDEISTRNMEARSALKSTLEGVLAGLWEQFQEAKRNYENSTADKRSEFERLKTKDQESTEIINQQVRKMARYQDQVQSWKARIATKQTDFEKQCLDLRHEKETVLTLFRNLKEELNSSRSREKSSLTQLTVETSQTAEKLQQRIEVAEKIIKQGELCRKFESEEEKVLPFYQSSLTVNDTPNEGIEPVPAVSDPHHAVLSTLEGYQPVENELLENFWKRYNKALLEKLAIEKERAELEDENLKLRFLLKQYLDGISVNEEILENNNTLLVVGGCTSKLPVIPVGDTRVKPKMQAAGKRPIIEATEVVNSTQRMGYKL